MYLRSGGGIIFQSPRSHAKPNRVDLYTMDADDVNQRRHVVRSGFDGVPVPSPDGRQIAFMRGAFDAAAHAYHWDLLVCGASGGNIRPLTNNRWSRQVPSWMPGGEEIVFYTRIRRGATSSSS